MIPFSKFFTYMTKKDKILMICGTVSSVLAGFLLPCISLAMGSITNTYDTRNNPHAILDQMRFICLYICLVGLGTWVFGYIYYAFWQHLA